MVDCHIAFKEHYEAGNISELSSKLYGHLTDTVYIFLIICI